MKLSTRGRLLAAVPLLLTGALLVAPAAPAAAAPASVTAARGDGRQATTPSSGTSVSAPDPAATPKSEPAKDAPSTTEPAPTETEKAKEAPTPTPDDASKAEHPAKDAADTKDTKKTHDSGPSGGATQLGVPSSTVDAPPPSTISGGAAADPAPFNAEPAVPATTLATAPLAAMAGVSLGPGLVIWPLLLAIDIVAIAFLVRLYLRRRATPAS